MNNIKKSILFLASILLIGFTSQAQELTNSVTKEISKSASKGELYDYFINKEENQIELAYKLKETPKKLVMETYYFKLDDLSFISSKEEEFEIEKVKYKKVKVDRKQKADPVKLLKVSASTINGKLKLHKGHLYYWTAGRAILSKFVEEYTKEVSTSQGDKFIYLSHNTEMNDVNDDLESVGLKHMAWGHITIGLGNLSIIGMEKTKPYYSRYAFTIYDAHSLEEKLYKTFDLGYSFLPMSIKLLPNGDYGLLFKPLATTNVENFKIKDPDKFKKDPENNFKYIQVNTKGEKVVDVNFKLPITNTKGNFNVQIIPTDTKGEVILLGMYNKDMFGAAIQLNPKFIGIQNNGSKINIYKPAKATGLIIKIANNKIEFKKEFDLDKLLSNVQSTKGTKIPDYPLQDFEPSTVTTDKEGNILIGGLTKISQIFQIDKTGNITTYLDAPDQDWIVSTQFIKNSNDEIYWVNTDKPKYKSGASAEDQLKSKNQQLTVISKINSADKKLGESISLTIDGIFIDIDEPIKMITQDEMLILGHGKKKEISLSKIVLN